MLPLRDKLPTRTTPWVTYTLIALNVMAYLYERALVGAGYTQVIAEWGLVPARFWAAPWLEAPNVLSSMFMHAPSTWWHLGSNMLFLWIFGDNVEDALGHARYLAFYLLAGVAAALAQVAIGPSSMVPMVGASGAIAGVLAAYGSLYPRAPITVLNPVPLLWLFLGFTFTLPAWLVILQFFALNLLGGLGSLGQTGGGVAFFAHLGGFLAGLALVRALLPKRPPPRMPARPALGPPAPVRVVRFVAPGPRR